MGCGGGGGVKRQSFYTRTLLSELGIIASVIQEPKRDPEALTVIGLLTVVRRPQPVDKVFVFDAQ